MTMTNETTEQRSVKISISKSAARAKKKLQELKEIETKRIAAAKDEKLRLEQEIEELEAKERQQRRRFLNEQRDKVHYALGKLLLSLIAASKNFDFQFSRENLTALSESDSDRLLSVLEQMSAAQEAKSQKIKSKPTDNRESVLQSSLTH